MRLRRFTWMLVVLMALTCASSFAAQPERAKKYQLAIDKGSLSSVLEQFSQQTQLQTGTQLNVHETEIGEVGPFTGQATADQALTALLEDTGLSYTWQDEFTLRIFPTVVRQPRAEDNVQEVVVTGSRLPNAADGPAPIRVYGRGKIDRSGASSLPDFSRYLTQQPFSFSAGHLQSGAQYIQLRGLGFDSTLVLLNGRRFAPSANSVALNAVDLNSIPLTAVERIEVMSDSASAIYGTDAIGGVVNIILKDTIDRPEVHLHYGQADGGGDQRRAAVSLGGTTDRWKSTFLLDYYDTGALMGVERDLSSNQDYRRYGGRDYRVSSINPGNVYSLTGTALPGLSSSRAAVPFGTTGALTLADFLATDGGTNLYSSSSDWSIVPPAERISAYGSAERLLGENSSMFAEVLVANGKSIALRSPPSLSRHVVPADNPYNPFGVPVAVDYSFAGMDPISHTFETDLVRLVGGARGSIDRWQWEIAALGHREDGSNTSRGAIDPLRVIAAVNSTDPATALNLFSEGPAGSAELLSSLAGSPQRNNFSFSSSQLSAFMRGPLFNMSGRPAEWVIGGELRRDTTTFFESKRIDADQDIASVFSEIRLPLLDTITLKLAGRFDDYGNGQWIVNPQYGFTWKPAKDWLFRAAYGTSFRPPSLFELHMPSYQALLPVADPRRGGEVTNVTLVVGGNPDLGVVTARSFTTGFVFSPAEMSGLHMGVSYWQLAIDHRITTPNYQELLQAESPITGRVVRDPASDQDLQAGRAGPLRTIDVTRVNFGSLETRGIDLDASLVVEHFLGCLRFDLAFTWIDAYLSHDMNPLLPANRIGIANAQGTIPEWRTVGSLSWKFGDFGASTSTTFIPSYRDSDFAMGALDRRIGSQALVDVQAWAHLNFKGNPWLDGSRVTLGARNVFDNTPQYAYAGANLGYDVSQSDLTGRFIYLRISKQM